MKEKYDHMEFITQEGKTILKSVLECGLSEFYSPQGGNIMINLSEYAEIADNVFAFLKDNKNWVMGITKEEEEEFIYLCEFN